MHTAERYHDISCGHRVCGHENKCRHLHGHNYRIIFTVAANKDEDEPELDHIGRVVDFGVIKDRLCDWLERNWDHKFLAFQGDALMRALVSSPALDANDRFDVGMSMVWLDFNPTAENMARYLVEVIGPQQLRETGVTLIACKIEETRKCSATYYKDDI